MSLPLGKDIFFVARIITFVVGLWMVASLGYAQERNAFIDTIKHSFQHRPTLDLRLDSRNSFISTRFARIFGVKAGLDFNKRVKVGLGYNHLVSEIDRDIRTTDAFGVTTVQKSTLRFWYFTPYFEYAFYQKHPWEISIPVHLGIGASRYRYKNTAGDRLFTEANLVVLYEPYMVCQYRFLRYFALGAGVGFRLLMVGNGGIPENLNSPNYVIKFKVFIADFYKDVSGNN